MAKFITLGKYTAKDIKDKDGKIILLSGKQISEKELEKINESNINSIKLVNIDPINKGPYILQTLKESDDLEITNKTEALNAIYKVLRPGEAPTIEIAEEVIKFVIERIENS